MFKNILFFAAGALVMRYIILHTDNYQQKEAEEVDSIRNKVHDLIKKYNPDADDQEVGSDVMNTFPVN
jgi:hypothetical protein